ncbi:MAG: beta/gamma crystallin-related protein [Micropepsaceae bacterium]
MTSALSQSAWALLAALAVASAADAAAAPVPPPAAAAPVPLVIVVYDQPNYMGHAVTIDRAVPDLAAIKFDDKVASFEIRGAGDWMLCENRNYAGRCVRVQSRADDLKILQIGGRVSSLYPVPATPAGLITP